jgi:hypothetical protein
MYGNWKWKKTWVLDYLKEARIYARSAIRYMAGTWIYVVLSKIHANTLILEKEIKETPTYKRRQEIQAR